MDPSFGSVEELPVLYRSILDLVDQLERLDRRREAERIRSQALAVYASSWSPQHRQRLEQLAARLRRTIESERPSSRAWHRLS